MAFLHLNQNVGHLTFALCCLLAIVSLFRMGITSLSIFLKCQVQSSWDAVGQVFDTEVSALGFPQGWACAAAW